MSNEMMKREMQEAVQAGERALQSLYAARDKLGSARNWGIFDMLGGGFWTGWWQIIWCRARLQMQENRWMMPSTG